MKIRPTTTRSGYKVTTASGRNLGRKYKTLREAMKKLRLAEMAKARGKKF